MTRRVLLNSSGLKISQPGADVLTAGPAQLQFSSDFSSLSLYMQGDYSLSWSVAGNIGSHVGFIPFGKTFVSPPSVWLYQVGGGYLVPLGNAYGVNFHVRETSLPGQARDWYVNAAVLTNGIDIRGFYNKQTSGWPQPSMTLRYFVFDYNL